MKLEGKNIVLRDFMSKDLEKYWQWLQPGHKWQQYDAPYEKDTPDSIGKRFERKKSAVESNQYSEPRGSLLIADKNTDMMIGEVNSYWKSKETYWMCIGIDVFDDANWGKGVGKEALTIWIQYLFDNRPELVRLGMETWSGNIGMIKLSLKLGYIEEARYRKARIVNGKYYDSVAFGVLREEWKEIYKSAI